MTQRKKNLLHPQGELEKRKIATATKVQDRLDLL